MGGDRTGGLGHVENTGHMHGTNFAVSNGSFGNAANRAQSSSKSWMTKL